MIFCSHFSVLFLSLFTSFSLPFQAGRRLIVQCSKDLLASLQGLVSELLCPTLCAAYTRLITGHRVNARASGFSHEGLLYYDLEFLC